MKQYFLRFKWTVSKGRQTYGYNICTLYVDGVKKGRCNGGGYDMTGTSFAQWLETDFSNELRHLFSGEIESIKNGQFKGTFKNSKDQEFLYSFPAHFYGVTIYYNTATGGVTVSLDGACGFSSMQKIGEAIGIKLKWNPESDKSKNNSYYLATYEPKTAEAAK